VAASNSCCSMLAVASRCLTCIRLPNAGSKPDKSCNLTLLDFSSENCRKQFYAREFPTSGPVFPGVLGNKSRNLTPRRAARTRGFDGLAFGRRHSLRERRPREVEVVTVATSGRRPVTGRCQFPSRFSDCFWASWTRLRSGTAESIGTMSIGEPSTKYCREGFGRVESRAGSSPAPTERRVRTVRRRPSADG